MSGYQHFKAFLAELKSQASKQDGVYIPNEENPLLIEKGVILVSQKDVRRLDLARNELKLAAEKIKSACSAMHGFSAISMSEVEKTQAVIDSYDELIQDVVTKAYQRRRDAVVGVAV